MTKYISIFLLMILFSNSSSAQDPNYNNYEKQWQEVLKLEREGLTKSANEAVAKIKIRARSDANSVQMVKVLLFESKYALTLEEDAQLKIITDIKVEIAKSEFPTKNILENILANLYWQYFQQNRWQFYNRTNTETKVDAADFRTWDLQTLFDEIHLYYQESLKNGLIAQRTSLELFDDILHTQKDSKVFRPTLFDFLNHNALQFYKTPENQITQPAYKFEISDSTYLSDAISFSKIKITSKDTTSLQLHALKIYQNLIQFHLRDGSQQALADVNLERLLYVKQNATFRDKEELLLKALKTESDLHSNDDISALYDYEIANIYFQQGRNYNHKTNPEPRWKIKEALDICEAVIQKFPKSKGAEKCAILKNDILNKALNITNEEFIPINKESKILVNYKNFDQLHFKIFPLTNSQLEKLQKAYRKEDQIQFISTLKALKKWPSILKDEHDYQQHSTEIVIPKLGNGHYMIYASPKSGEKNTFAFGLFQATNFALVERKENGKQTYQVIDRSNGHPISGATVNFKNKRQRYEDDRKLNKTLKTDAKGQVTLETTSNHNNVEITVTKDTEKAYFNNYYFNGRYNDNDKERTRHHAFLFTDRSIYRPGQTVYFKGIGISQTGTSSELLIDQIVTVTLEDVNSQIISTLKFKTNDYGSFHGEFILPSNGLTGNFTLSVRSKEIGLYSNTSISCEEYKRPKFETTFNPVTETYKINDAIVVKGVATAYAGSNITEAKVVYRVHRKVQYPRWYYWYRPYFNSEPQEIEHGETITNDKGEYEILFKAIPDKSVSKDDLPVFNYEITADVTDINGETRSTTTIVRIGYHALMANIGVSERLNKTDKDHKLNITTENLNGEFVPTKGSIKIYKLVAPQQVLRPRPWSAPDYPNLSETEFKRLFPYEAYNDEHNSSTRKKGKLIFDTTFDTNKSKEIDLGNMKRRASGQYVIELETKDKFGQTVKDIARTTLYSNNDKTVADSELFRITTNASSYKSGDNVIVTLASAAPELFVTVDLEKDGKISNTYIVTLHNNKKTLKIPVTKDDVGGFAIHTSLSAYNSYQNGTTIISVPYPKTDLEIETMTFRDKLQPGTDETWSFKLKGPKGDKVAAELLASMYDASLDQFKPHSWNFNPFNRSNYYSRLGRNAQRTYQKKGFRVHIPYKQNNNYTYQQYDQLNWFGLYFGNNRYLRRSAPLAAISMDSEENLNEVVMDEANDFNNYRGNTYAKNAVGGGNEGSIPAEIELDTLPNGKIIAKFKEKKQDFSGVTIRKNLQETAFFFPQLQTDKDGNVSFSFTTPEALTKWNLQLLAHTKNLESATQSLETVTQKELMVIPNAPRFLREGDQITISTKIANLSDTLLSGNAVLQLFDAVTGKPIDGKLANTDNEKAFTVDSKGNTQVSWGLNIPDDVQAVQYKVIAKAGDFSDGEQNALPVLSNRILVTETMPMWVRSNQTKTFTLDKLKNTSSTSLKHHQLTLEMTSNPAWYAVQALPYLMEYPYECNEQIFSRYYANALASHIANSNPRIQEVFNQWRNTDALLSNLEKNQELKSLLIQETPWLRDAQSETEQKKRIALLFDLNKMNNELASAKLKLKNSQLSSGAWSWFNGGRHNRYITQHIITGFGHLKHLNVMSSEVETSMIEKAIRYLDAEFVQEYKDIKKYNKDVDLSKDHLSYTQLHYLYMRSFYSDIKRSNEVEKITNYYTSQIQKYWLSRPLYAKGLMALVMDRKDDSRTAKKIIRSLKENSITSEELGMYWKENTNSWHWYQAPIETQALLIEAFSEIENDAKTIDNLKIWLLKNKQTNQWKTTKATTEAVYALLLQGSDWISVTDMVDVVLGGQKISPQQLEAVKVEAGTGYYKTAWNSAEVKPKMAEVTVSKKGKGIAWGALYWQYFEDLDKITSAETPLKLKKKLFKKTNTDKGEKISEISSDSQLKVGDLVRVRIELRADRPMEFVHMKDMRASGLEPVNVISKYKWQDGLGYYESTKDASTNFFFDYLPKGVYVFEYDLRVNNAGDMSNGITTIQSMYAPEFSSHSEGVRIKVD